MLNQKVTSFIEQHFLVQMGSDFQSDSNLFDSGIIDSFGYVELVAFLEKEFSISLSEQELISGSLSSVDGIVSLLNLKLAGAHA